MTVKELYEQVRDGHIISDIDLQREIVYDVDKQRLVIDSIVKGIPLPAFYFWRNENDILEVLDGKQRVEAIKRFKENDIQFENKLWKQTSSELQTKINDTELTVIIRQGEEQLKREIFRRINTLGVPLSPYEVLNGLFHGEYLRGLSTYVEQDRDAKKVFGSNSRGKNQMKVLILLLSLKHLNSINDYVNQNQNNSFAEDQRLIAKYIKFIADVFDEYGHYKIYFDLAVKYQKDIAIWKQNKREINRRLKLFFKSDEAKIIKDKAGEIEDIIQSVVKNISVDSKRLFTIDEKKQLLEKQQQTEDGKYHCACCGFEFAPDELTVDHIKPWSKGGRTVLSNAQLLCRACNSKKGNRL